MLPFIGIILVLLGIWSGNGQEERDTKHIALKGEPIFGVRHEGHSFTRVCTLPILSQTGLNTEVNTTHLMPENFKFGRVPGSVFMGRSFSCISYVALSPWMLRVTRLMQNEYETKGEVTVRTLQKFMPYLGVESKVGPGVGCQQRYKERRSVSANIHSSIDQSKCLVNSSWAKAELKCGAKRFSEPTVALVVLFPYLNSAVIDARKAP